jgi:hypothetical protein
MRDLRAALILAGAIVTAFAVVVGVISVTLG